MKSAVLFLSFASLLWPSQKLTPDKILNGSPWAVTTGAEIIQPKENPRDKDIPLPKPSNQPDMGPSYASDGYGVDDGKWDGGVGKMRTAEPPKLPVLIRWDSAAPVREAMVATHDADVTDTGNTLGTAEKYYIISVIGLIPARKPKTDDDDQDSQAPPLDVKELRNRVAATARLLRYGKPAIPPEQVTFDETTGELRLFFPRTDAITAQDKEIVFRARYGSLQIAQRFRLKDMFWKGSLAL